MLPKHYYYKTKENYETSMKAIGFSMAGFVLLFVIILIANLID